MRSPERQSLHLAAEMEGHAELLLAVRLEFPPTNFSGSRHARRAVRRCRREQLLDRRQRRLDRDAARRVDRLEQPVRLQQLNSATFLSIASRRV